LNFVILFFQFLISLISYTQITKLPESYIKARIQEYFEEDFPTGDYTTDNLIDSKKSVSAYIQAEEELVVSGTVVLPYFFSNDFNVEILKQDKSIAKNGDIIARITGKSSEILTKERTLLNLMQRLCGVATLTKKFVDLAKPYNVTILDTRKTMPGMRLFDKYAVTCGGGQNHRLNLSSGILIKDNHISAAGGVSNAVKQIGALVKTLKIELEVDDFSQLNEGLNSGIDGVLLDNMSPAKIADAVEIIRKHPLGKELFIEASGGINLENIGGYLVTGIDAISIGAITHSVKNSNIHLEFE